MLFQPFFSNFANEVLQEDGLGLHSNALFGILERYTEYKNYAEQDLNNLTWFEILKFEEMDTSYVGS